VGLWGLVLLPPGLVPRRAFYLEGDIQLTAGADCLIYGGCFACFICSIRFEADLGLVGAGLLVSWSPGLQLPGIEGGGGGCCARVVLKH